MVVYGRNHTKYVLSSYPQTQDNSGSSYTVEDNNDILVKVYDARYRTQEEENRILSACRRSADVEGLVPMDAVYIQGNFVGFTYGRVAVTPPEPVMPPPTSQRHPSVPQPVKKELHLLITIVLGIAMSVLLYFCIFDELAYGMDARVAFYNFNGIPMIVVGAILMFLVYARISRSGNTLAAMFVSIPAYAVGAVLGFCIIWLIVFLVELSKAILPGVVVLVIVIALLKSVFSRRTTK